MDNIDKYLDLFISESKEHLDSLDTLLIELEKDPQKTEILMELMRHSHTLKGIAASVGFGEISNLAHSFEGMVENIKNKLSSGGINLLFGAVDELRKMIEQAEKTGPTQSANPLVDKVGELEQDDIQEDKKTIEDPAQFAQIKEVRVKTTKLDQLMNIVSEMIVNKLRLKGSVDQESIQLMEAFEEYERLVESLQYHVLQLRLTPVGQVFNRFPRMVRDQSTKQNKKITFEVKGSEIEIDRSILDDLGEPLVHILRNAVDHGIENEGVLSLVAEKVRDKVVISVADNGQGIDWEKIEQKMAQKNFEGDREDFLFSGVSTAEQVTETSGRGVGLSVVKQKIEAMGGQIKIDSQRGKGTTFIIDLPVSLAIVKGIIIDVELQKYAITLSSVHKIIDVAKYEVKKQADYDVIVIDEQEVPLIYLNQVFRYLYQPDQALIKEIEQEKRQLIGNKAILVNSKDKMYAFVIDSIYGQQDIIVKPVTNSLKGKLPFSSVTLMGDGRPVPIIDPELVIKSSWGTNT